MQFYFFLMTSLFATNAYLSSSDLFALEPDFFSNDASTLDANLLFGDEDGPQPFADNIWTDDGSELLTFDAGDRNSQPLGLISSSSFDGPTNLQLSSPPDLSTLPGAIQLPGQEVSITGGEGCSANSMMSSPISKRGGLDWFWNMFKDQESSPNNSPKTCPAPGSAGGTATLEPETQTGGDGPNGGDDDANVCGNIILLCCRDELAGVSVTLEQCWDYRPKLRLACNYRQYLWCCLTYDPETGDAGHCTRAYPGAG